MKLCIEYDCSCTAADVVVLAEGGEGVWFS